MAGYPVDVTDDNEMLSSKKKDNYLKYVTRNHEFISSVSMHVRLFFHQPIIPFFCVHWSGKLFQRA
jgi:hypothetical protein